MRTTNLAACTRFPFSVAPNRGYRTNSALLSIRFGRCYPLSQPSLFPFWSFPTFSLIFPFSLSYATHSLSLSFPFLHHFGEGAPITAICGLCFPTLSVLPTFPDPFYPSRFPFLPLSCAGRRTEPPLSGSARLSLCLPLLHRPYDNGPALYLSGAIPPLSGGRGGRHATRSLVFFLSLLLSLLSVLSLFFPPPFYLPTFKINLSPSPLVLSPSLLFAHPTQRHVRPISQAPAAKYFSETQRPNESMYVCIL